jgi:hypothetical protein
MSLDDPHLPSRPASPLQQTSPSHLGVPWSDDYASIQNQNLADYFSKLRVKTEPGSDLSSSERHGAVLPSSPFAQSPTEAMHSTFSGARPSTVPQHEVNPPLSGAASPKGSEQEAVHAPPPPTPELADPQSFKYSAGSPTIDLPAIVYAAKGKVKESRRSSGIARDVLNAA